jgi:AcrR family transcriptional regulator
MPGDGGSDEDQRVFELLWGQRSEPRRGPKPSLNVERIATTAVAIADAEGLEAVSMQRVARECGVTTMALYRYMPGKAELVALMLDVGLGAPPPLEGEQGDWRTQLVDWARRLWTVFQRHPWSLAATAPVRLMGPNELRWFEIAVSALSGTNLTSDEAAQAVLAILLHVRGMVASSLADPERQRGVSRGRWGAAIADPLRQHSDSYPALSAALAAGAFGAPTDGALDFGHDFGLLLLLDGMNAHITKGAIAREEGR